MAGGTAIAAAKMFTKTGAASRVSVAKEITIGLVLGMGAGLGFKVREREREMAEGGGRAGGAPLLSFPPALGAPLLAAWVGLVCSRAAPSVCSTLRPRPLGDGRGRTRPGLARACARPERSERG